VKTHSHTLYITGKNVKNKWKHLRDNFRAELNRPNANKSGDLVYLPAKGSLSGDGLRCYFF